MCDIHNEANIILEKKEFDCKKIEEKWGGSCDGCEDDF